MINVSLQYCVLNFSQVQYIDLSEIVQFVKAGIIFITVHLRLSTLVVISHVLVAKVSPECRLNLVFETQKKCPFSLEGGVPSIEVTDTKIM